MSWRMTFDILPVSTKWSLKQTFNRMCNITIMSNVHGLRPAMKRGLGLEFGYLWLEHDINCMAITYNILCGYVPRNIAI